MKKCLLIFVSIFLISTCANAQYKVNKNKYDHHTYTHQAGDRYSVAAAGWTSFLLPGLGQMISGEGGRGAAFLVPYIGCLVVYGVGAGASVVDIDEGGDGTAGAGIMLAGLAGAIVVDIWAIIDAKHVAKVNNLAYRDKSKTGYNIQLQPYFNFSNYQYTSNVPVGLSMKVAF
jgi:hypothetical protein